MKVLRVGFRVWNTVRRFAAALVRWGFAVGRDFEIAHGGVAPLAPMRASREAHVQRHVTATHTERNTLTDS